MLGVVGDLVEDIVVWLREPLQLATDTDVQIFRRRGGSAANVAAFSAAGYPTRFIGCVGRDRSGTGLVAELEAHGVDVRVQWFGVTGTVIALVDEHGERSMLPDRGAALHLTDVDQSWTDDLEHLHVPAYSLFGEPIATTTVGLIGRMHRNGATVSIDPSSTGLLRRYGRERAIRLLADMQPHLLFPNSDEAAYLGLVRDGRPGATLGDLPGTTVVVKNATHPTIVFAPDAEPFDVPVSGGGRARDTTGAGDAFAAGFLVEFLRHGDLRVACEAGHATAATVLQTPGASTSQSEESGGGAKANES